MRKRHGFTLLECSFGCILLVFLMSLTLTFFSSAMRQTAADDRQQLGIWEASNQLERLAGLDRESLQADLLKQIEPSAEAKSLLPECKIDAKLEPTDLKGFSKLRLEVRWMSRTMPQKAELATFVWLPKESP